MSEKARFRSHTLIPALTLIILISGCANIMLPGSSSASPDEHPLPGEQTSTPNPTPSPGGQTPEPAQSESPEAPQETPSKELSLAERLLNSMTLEEKVGQMFLVDYPGSDAEKYAQEYAPGGYLMFASFFENRTKEDVRLAISNIQAASRVPMFIAVDEEGGTVNRVSLYAQFRGTKFRSPRSLFQEGGFDLIESDTIEKSRLLLSLGVNFNLCPVCDVSGSPEEFMYSRSFSGDAQEVSKFADLVTRTMKEQSIGSALKHFPGYGNNADTHTQIVHDDRDYSVFLNSDFLPFIAGARAGADCVLVSHNIVECMDPEYPASLSAQVNRVLREELAFDGVVMTDSLSMDAITDYTNGTDAAVIAVEAGNDLLCSSDFTVQIPAVIEAVKSGRITQERLDDSVLRILNMKIDLGLITGDNISNSQ